LSTFKRSDWLAAIPAVAALSLGVIYALGAIAVYGQIKGAGLNAVQTMPLVPLEQMLGRGIGSVTSELAQTVVVSAGLVFLMLLLRDRPEASDRPDESSGKGANRSAWIGLGGFGFLLVAFFVTYPLDEAMVILIAVSAQLACMFWLGQRIKPRRDVKALVSLGLASIFAFTLASAVASSFLTPAALPQIKLELNRGCAVAGDLVAMSNGVWYVGTEGGGITAIEIRQVRRTTITYPPRTRRRSLLDMALSRPASTPLGKPLNEPQEKRAIPSASTGPGPLPSWARPASTAAEATARAPRAASSGVCPRARRAASAEE
jgi:hypothetical protein